MRAVALADEQVQQRVRGAFVPLKVAIRPGTDAFPLDWPALRGWASVYRWMGGDECQGITGCSVVTPDLRAEYGNTGSAMVWEMFDSIAYDANKFGAMLDRALARYRQERQLRERHAGKAVRLWFELSRLRGKVRRELRTEGRFRLPPKGFDVEGAKQLFRMTGDLVEPAAGGGDKGGDDGEGGDGERSDGER